MENLEQAFVDYASSHTDEARGLVFEFMASQDARLSKFEADFKQQQSEITNKIDTVLKAITDRIAGTLPRDTVKKPKLVQSTPSQSTPGSLKNPKLMSLTIGSSIPQFKFVCSKEDDGEVMFIEIIQDDDEPQNKGPNEGEGATTEGLAVEYFDTFPTRDELTTIGKILGFYKECLELGLEYVIGLDDEGEVTKDEQNAEEPEDERVLLASLIANLNLDVDENKKIQKQLKKANMSLTEELDKYKLDLKIFENRSLQNVLVKEENVKLHKIDWQKPITHDIKLLVYDMFPLAHKTLKNVGIFENALKEEMLEDLKYVQSVEKQVDDLNMEINDLKYQLKHEKTNFLKVDDLLLQEFFSKDFLRVILLSLDNIDEYCEMACKYLEKTEE
nr:ribonuclease H-like domain-containing protein [Tanacetum cinerariifolium]